MRQILMTPANARRIKHGKKWETRRIVKTDQECRYGGPGDLLWVRENWQLVLLPFGDIWQGPAKQNPGGDWCPIYQADMDECERWRPSIHMPKWACRFILRINRVHQERLHEITEAGAQAEGVSSVEVYRREWIQIHGKDSWDANPAVWVIRYTRTEPHRCTNRRRIGSAQEP